MREPMSVQESSGNVFAALNIAGPKGTPARATLTRRIGAIIKKRGLSQAGAARLLGLDPPKVSARMRDQLTGFSSDRLLRGLIAF